jgi:hypothetical protein
MSTERVTDWNSQKKQLQTSPDLANNIFITEKRLSGCWQCTPVQAILGL